MKTKKIALAVVLISLFCWLAIPVVMAQKPPLPSNVIPDGLGYNIHFTDARPGEMEMLADSGATIIRMDFGWNGTEREKGIYDFSAFERLTDSLEKHNIRPLYILDYSNRHYDEGLSPYSDEGRAAFAKWAAAAAVHFKDRGIIWEMYNEPNIRFWRPEPKSDDYIKLALETGKAIREAAPNELYIGPATSEIDMDFLEQCFQGGLLEYWDAVSVHPYRQKGPETAIPEYAKLRWLIDKYAPEGKHIPILSAEWGYSSAWGNYNDDIQGKMLPRQWMVNLACDVPISIWYDWHDDGRDPKEPEHHFGTTNFEYHRDRTPVYDPKPSYIAAKTFSETFKGFQFNKRIDCGNPDVYLFLFSKGKEHRLALWTTSKEQQEFLSLSRIIPFEPGTTFQIIDHLGQEIVKNYDLWDDPEIDLEQAIYSDAPIYVIPENNDSNLNTVAEYLSLPMALYLTESKCKELNDLLLEQDWDGIAAPQLQWERFRLPEPTPCGFFHQKMAVHSTRPIIVRPSWGENKWFFGIDNPSGDAFSGSLVINDSEGNTSFRIVDLKEGETHKTVPFPLVRMDVKFHVNLYGSETHDDDNTISVFPLFPNNSGQLSFALFDDFSKYDAASFAETWQVLPDGDNKVGSEQSVELTGEKLAKVTYKFEDGWKFVRLAPKKAMPIEGQPKSMTVSFNADGSGNRIGMRFADSKGQTFQPKNEPMTREGRQYVTFDLTGKDTSHWGGPNDGVVHYPIRFDSIIIDGTRKACGPFSVEFASPVLVYGE